MATRILLFLLVCFTSSAQITNVNIGTSANDGAGDSLRTAFSKVNTNTAWLLSQLGASTNASTTLSNLWRVSLTPTTPSLSTNWLQITTWGDSLTAGSGASPSSNAYPATLGRYTGFTVSNGGVPGETVVQVATRMLAATDTHANPTIIWAGTNGANEADETNYVAQMVSALATAGNTNRYLILPVFNSTNQYVGTAAWSNVVAINSTLGTIYGQNYLDVRSYLISNYDSGSLQDRIDYTNNVVPSSFRSDNLHLNNAGYAAVANHIATNSISVLRGSWGVLPTQRVILNEFEAPPHIGAATPNLGTFTTASASTVVAPTVNLTNNTYSKGFTLSGDGVTIYSFASLSPSTDGGMSLGYSDSNWRWQNGRFTGYVNAASVNLSSSLLTPLVRITNNTYIGQISQSGDGLSLFFDKRLSPSTDDSQDLGYSSSYRWRNAYLSQGLFAASSFLTGSSTANSFVITNNTYTGSMSLTGDGSAISFNRNIIPDGDGTRDLSYGPSSIRWRNGYFTGSINAGTLRSYGYVYGLGLSVTNNTYNGLISMTGDGTSFAFDKNLISDSDGTRNIGYNSGANRFGSAWLTSTIQAPTHVIGNSGAPTITSGTGVPSSSQPNGSLFLRTDGTGPNLYVRENGAWVSK